VLITIVIALLFPNSRLVLCQIFFYDCHEIRNLPKIFLRTFNNLAPVFHRFLSSCIWVTQRSPPYSSHRLLIRNVAIILQCISAYKRDGVSIAVTSRLDYEYITLINGPGYLFLCYLSICYTSKKIKMEYDNRTTMQQV